MSNLVALPVAAPLATALVMAVARRGPAFERRVAVVGAIVTLAAALGLIVLTARGDVLVLRLGSWPPVVGIVWVADRLSAIMVLLAAVVSLATVVFATDGLPHGEAALGYFPIHALVVAGVNGAFVTGDLFNLFVCFEILLVASFVLIALGGRPRQLNAALPYVIVNLLASALLLGGVGAVYGALGTVNMAMLAERVAAGTLPAAAPPAFAVVLVAFAVKAALVPVFSWLPDSYPRAPIAASALFAGLLTRVGVYALFRLVPILAGPAPGPAYDVVLAVSAITMLVGVLGALGRHQIRSILAFHIVSQVGYMTLALGLGTDLAIAAGLFFVVHQIIVKTAAFLAGGTAELIAGTGRLGAASGLARSHPWVAAGFFIPAMALAGMPPLSGFWAKLFVLHAGFARGAYLATTVGLLVSFLTLASMLKIWTSVFWGVPTGVRDPAPGLRPRVVGPALALGAISIGLGLAAAPLYPYFQATAREIRVPTAYLEAVLRPTEKGAR